MNEIIVKFANQNIKKELESIGFDKSHLRQAINKYHGTLVKVKNLKAPEANILKQLCLSLGFDCAVHRETITCKCDYTDCIIFANIAGYKKLTEKLKQQPFRLKELSSKLHNALNNMLEPLHVRNTLFDWTRPYVMGILNVTPDSFSDGGKFNNKNAAVNHAVKMIEEGADIIDIGGESTRPNAAIITPEEEINRIIPVIKEIRKLNQNIPISVDTRNYLTAKAAIEEGADIVNDVSGLDYDKKLFDYVCELNIPTIIMHSNKVPAVSENAVDSDIIEEIYNSLYKKIGKMIISGHRKGSIIADTGIGFGKSKDGCFDILSRHEEFCALGVPLLLGISRKSFIRKEFNITCEEADIPTALYSAMLSSQGVNIHRVHNVKLTKQYLDFAAKINFSQ